MKAYAQQTRVPAAERDALIASHIEVARRRMGRYGQGTREVRDVQKATMDMGQHSPERPQSPRGKTQPESGHVALEKGRYIGTEPLAAVARLAQIVDWGKSPPEPAILCPCRTRKLCCEEWGEFQQRNPARQGLGDRTHQSGAC